MADAWILADPAQDYEESLTILGVYDSRDAAMAALPELRQKGYENGGHYGPYEQWRESELQRWRGDQCVETWMYTPREADMGHEGWRKTG